MSVCIEQRKGVDKQEGEVERYGRRGKQEGERVTGGERRGERWGRGGDREREGQLPLQMQREGVV